MRDAWRSAQRRLTAFVARQQGAVAMNAGLVLIPVMIAASFVLDGALL